MKDVAFSLRASTPPSIAVRHIVMLSKAKHLCEFLRHEILHSLARVQNDNLASLRASAKQSTMPSIPRRSLATFARRRV